MYLRRQGVPGASLVAEQSAGYFNRYGGGRAMIEGGEFLLDFIENGAAADGREKAVRKTSAKQKRRAKMMSKSMKAIRSKAYKKNGQLKKGWSQSRIMKEAHKDCNRRMK